MQLLSSMGCYHCKTCINELFAKLAKHRPHVVIFDVGTNDVDKSCDVCKATYWPV